MQNILKFDSKEYSKCKSEEEKIDKMGKSILNETILMINGEEHRICEVEFYLLSKSHPDPFVHGDKDQQTPMKWYFHKMNGTYKSGTYKGLDLTFGYNDDSYGGMLIRSIKPNNKSLIEGPCKVVDYILNKCETESVEKFVGGNGLLSALECNKLYVKHDKNKLKKEEVFTGPRVGLTLKKKNGNRIGYVMKNYRYIIYPKDIKKYKNTLIANLLDKFDTTDISKLTGTSVGNIEKYRTIYNEGSNKQEKDFYGINFKSDELLHLYKLTNHKN